MRLHATRELAGQTRSRPWGSIGATRKILQFGALSWPTLWFTETYLILASQQHAALQTFSGVMLGFGVPLTVVTLVATMIRRPNTTGQR